MYNSLWNPPSKVYVRFYHPKHGVSKTAKRRQFYALGLKALGDYLDKMKDEGHWPKGYVALIDTVHGVKKFVRRGAWRLASKSEASA